MNTDSLSPHFTLSEFVRSARYPELVRPPTPEQRANLRRLVTEVLEPVRLKISRPLHVDSGLRSLELNAKIGGTPASDHLLGLAADVTIPSASPQQLRLLASYCWDRPSRQVIYYPDRNFVHVSVPAEGDTRPRGLFVCPSAGKYVAVTIGELLHWPEPPPPVA